MGVSLKIHLGPFLRCPNGIVTRTITIEGCPKCKRQHNQSFCCHCATPKGEFEKRQKESQISPYDIVGERLRYITEIDPATYFFIPNTRTSIKRKMSFDAQCDSAAISLPIAQSILREEIKIFNESFAPEIEKLQEHFGEEVWTDWGMLLWQY